MSNDPFTSFLLVADTQNGITIFVARSNTDKPQEFTLGPVQAAATAKIASQLADLAKHGFEHKFFSLAKHPTEIPHTDAQLSCTFEDLLEMGFIKS